jgi:hypothetical protein
MLRPSTNVIIPRRQQQTQLSRPPAVTLFVNREPTSSTKSLTTRTTTSAALADHPRFRSRTTRGLKTSPPPKGPRASVQWSTPAARSADAARASATSQRAPAHSPPWSGRYTQCTQVEPTHQTRDRGPTLILTALTALTALITLILTALTALTALITLILTTLTTLTNVIIGTKTGELPTRSSIPSCGKGQDLDDDLNDSMPKPHLSQTGWEIQMSHLRGLGQPLLCLKNLGPDP